MAWFNTKTGTLYEGDYCLPGDRAATDAEIEADSRDRAWRRYQDTAKRALEDTSTTMERIVEAVSLGKTTLDAADVVAFMRRREQLREILKSPRPSVIPSALPDDVPYPKGT